MKHPARFSKVLLPVLNEYLRMLPPEALILDPFAGVGTVHQLLGRTVAVELEPEWARMGSGPTVIADATRLPFPAATFAGAVSSPSYGNRLADKHNAKDGSVRRSYTHDLGRQLHPNNSGGMQWGEPYRVLHQQAWAELYRVLRGWFVLNISDHVRKGQIVPVTDWHFATLESLGFRLLEDTKIPTPRLRYGQNAAARVEHETVAVWECHR